MSFLINLFEWIETHDSPAVIAGISIGGIVLGIVLILLIIACIKIEKLSGVSSQSPIKILIIAAAPAVASLCSMLKFNINYSIILIIAAAACISVFIWNMLTYKTVYAIFFTIVHIVVGFIAGMSIVALVLLAIIFGALYLFGGFTGGVGTTASSTAATPELVYDVNTGETFNVRQELNGTLTAYGNGRDTIIRPVGGGRYIDDYGHEYLGN